MTKKQTREAIYDKYAGHCAYCGIAIHPKKWHIDHVIAQNRFSIDIKNEFQVPDFLKHLTVDDVHHIDNLNPSCRQCNNYKHSHTLEGFRREIGEQLKRLEKRSVNYRTAKRFGLVNETPKEIFFFFELCNQVLKIPGASIWGFDGKTISYIVNNKEHWIHIDEVKKYMKMNV